VIDIDAVTVASRSRSSLKSDSKLGQTALLREI